MTTTRITRADNFFCVEKLIVSDLQYTWFFSRWFVHEKKMRKTRSGFTFRQTKHHGQMQCQMSIANKSRNSGTPIKQWANEWWVKRKLLKRNLTKNLTPVFLSLWGNASRNFGWFNFLPNVLSVIYANSCCLNDSQTL